MFGFGFRFADRGHGAFSAAQVLRQVAGTRGPPEVANFSGQRGVLAEEGLYLTDDVTGEIEIAWPGWGVAFGIETASGTVSATAQITYTDKDSGLPVTVAMTTLAGGATLSNGADDNIWAKATINAAAGSIIWPRIRADFTSGFPYSAWKSDRRNGAKLQYAATVGALPALNGTITPSFAAGYWWYGPIIVRALADGSPVAGIMGDSIQDGIYDVSSTARGDIGQFGRLFGASAIPYVNASARGESALQFRGNTSNARRKKMLVDGGATFLAMGLGINDAGGRTGAQIMGDVDAIITDLDLPAVYKTIDPQTQNGWVTPASSTKTTNIGAFNALVRAKPIYYDTADVLEDGSTGAWASSTAVSLDYLHPQNLGNAYAAANAALVGFSIGTHGIAARAAGAQMPEGNLMLNPTDLSQASWLKQQATISDGGLVTQALMETAETNKHQVSQSVTKPAAAKMAIAFDVTFDKGRDYVCLEAFDGVFAGGMGAAFANDGNMANGEAFGGWTLGDNFRASHLNGNGVGIYVEVTTGANLTFWPFLMPSPDGFTKSYLGDITKGLSLRNIRVYEAI